MRRFATVLIIMPVATKTIRLLGFHILEQINMKETPVSTKNIEEIPQVIFIVAV